jgi:serine/threonine protein kinase
MSIDDDHTRMSGGADAPTLLSNSEQATILSPLSGSGNVPTERPGLEDGQLFGPYRIVGLLGRGGMGEVYEAEHLDTGRRVALKLLRGRIDRLEDRERFLQEGQMAASVSDPHTVYVFGSEEIDGMSAISMQLVPGGTLKDRVAVQGPQSVPAAVAAVLDVISGLDAALAAGVLHRDIKPSNCFVDADGSVKVGDFGLSIPAAGRSADRTFMGTPQFASPEQLRGDALDVRSDIYAVGATLYYLLTGAPPFEGKDFTTLIERVRAEPPPQAHKIRSGVPAALGTVVARCLAKDPADRPASYQDLARALRPFSPTGSPARLDVRILAGAIDLLLIAIPAGILNSSFGPPVLRRGSTSAEVDPWSFVIGVLYFAICEGLWSRTLGKRLFGLRVVSRAGAISWRQAAGRALTFYIPGLLMFVPTLVMGARPLAEYLVANPGLSSSVGVAQAVLMLLLFSTIRRKNGYAAVHDLFTQTRVVQNVSRELRRRDAGDTVGVVPETGTTESAQRRLGPFIVGRELAVSGEARLFEGVDPVLKRLVWLVEWSHDAPETPKPRRDVARVGRLHWLAGRRTPDASWDALEAPQGAPLPAEGAGTAWPVVHGWLNDLAIELAAAERDGTTPPLGLDRVWIRPDGRAVLLDWPAPATEASAEPATAQQLLAGVGQYASSPPASAVAMLDRWRKKRAIPLDALVGDLSLVTASSGAVTRSRRAGPLVLVAAPVLLMLVIAVIANRVNVVMPHDRFVANELLDDLSDERDPERQQAFKVYLAGALRSELVAADAPWRSADMDDKDELALRALADEAAALTPNPAELAAAETMVASELRRAEEQFLDQDDPTTIVIALLLVGAAWSFCAGLVSVLVRPSGFVLSSLGLAVITDRGSEIGRVRAVFRLIVSWSPLLIYGALLAWPFTRAAVFSIAVVSLAAAPTFIGFVWALLRPNRGPHDMIVGTSIGAR